MAKFAKFSVAALVLACLPVVAASDRAQDNVKGGFAVRNNGNRRFAVRNNQVNSLDCSTYHQCLYFDGTAWDPAVFVTVPDTTTNVAVEWDLYNTPDCSDDPTVYAAAGPLDPGDWAFYVYNDPPYQDGDVVYMSTTLSDLDNGGSCYVGCAYYHISDFPASCF